jgi:hypothetical protein
MATLLAMAATRIPENPIPRKRRSYDTVGQPLVGPAKRNDNKAFSEYFLALGPPASCRAITEPQPMRHRAQFVAMAMAGTVILVAALMAGCGQAVPARAPVHGTVSRFNGEKLNGSISFLPAEGKAGPAATTRLADGEYQFDRKNGPAPGPHVVIIKKIFSKEAALKSMVEKKSATPGDAAAAKSEWSLTADVPRDPPYRCDFKLDD